MEIMSAPRFYMLVELRMYRFLQHVSVLSSSITKSNQFMDTAIITWNVEPFKTYICEFSSDYTTSKAETFAEQNFAILDQSHQLKCDKIDEKYPNRKNLFH